VCDGPGASMSNSPPDTFAALELLPSLNNTLNELGFVTPTEIQRRAMPSLLAGRSVVGVAETGSGKTLAYALPILHALKTLEASGNAITEDATPRAAVIVPSRDLGEQVTRVFKQFTHTTRLRVRSVLGGTTMEIARRNIQGTFEVLVATPGRLIKLIDRELIHLGDVQTLVFDEVDQMLDADFLPDAQRIVRECPASRQLALFSATVPEQVQDLIGKLFTGAEVIRSEGSHRVVATLKTINRPVANGKRLPHLRVLMTDPVTGGTLIFVNTREQCDTVAKELRTMGYTCVVYRGEMDKIERRANLKSFRDGTIPVLVSTDLAARGLDVDHVGRVINYHLPEQLDYYLHRVGRTARAGRTGVVINLVTERDHALMEKLANT
jgi:ATP-dependent RNA helicase RhlE